MANLTVLYTTTNAIRSVIGVDDADIEDEMITGQDMEAQMALALEKFTLTHASDIFDPTKAPSLKLWCMWFGGLRLAESPLAIAQAYGTGKDEFSRFVIDWEALRKLAKEKLAELQEEIVPTVATGFSLMGKATPDYNPIEGS
ncbi:MAG: hypothetical protein DRR06_12860 [Gammaproteobacteria bacterium]|nr:MAG: hypothetical protein DRR06_12860 [Gammaproteobacteria bacterium]